ncbi:MAG TPA: hypothetical protein VEX63_04125, partial [Flavisolibacter sp.]|nr:hypothetical protein [Flavisolibacter sp.]
MFQPYISIIKFSLLALALIFSAGAGAQSLQVLPGNGKFSPAAAPQGAVRAQRQFYLIDSAELAKAGLSHAILLQSIGFTLAVPQDTTTKGKFRVYLQNTTDKVSRLDTGWTIKTVSKNELHLTGLNAGNYEWQVRTNCTTASPFSPSNFFDVN